MLSKNTKRMRNRGNEMSYKSCLLAKNITFIVSLTNLIIIKTKKVSRLGVGFGSRHL